MKNETFLHEEQTKEFAKLLAQNCESLSDVQSLLKNLFKGTIVFLPTKIIQKLPDLHVHE